LLALAPITGWSGAAQRGFSAAGIFVLLLVVLLVGGAFTGLAWHAGGLSLLDALGRPYTWSIVRFTLWQAMLSTMLSVALAIPLARALHRRQQFAGRRLLVRLTSVSLVVPTMVAILGMVAVHGRSGWINDLLSMAGLPRQDYLYGLTGILLAHVFFNLPLVTRLLLHALADIPLAQWRLATLYGFDGRTLFRLVEWPLIRQTLPGAAGIVFLLCFTSFAIVLSLGGGPGASTLEVAIYQALRFDFDLPQAVSLSLVQVVICSAIALMFFARRGGPALGAGDIGGEAAAQRPDRQIAGTLVVDTVVIGVAALFLLTPFAAVLVNTLDGPGWRIMTDQRFWRALGWTLWISLAAGTIATIAGFCVAWLRAGAVRSRRRWGAVITDLGATLTLILPPLTLGTGLFLLARRFTDALSLGHWMVIAINALFTLAFTLRVLASPVAVERNRFDPLCRSLGIRGYSRWRLIDWPVLKRPLCYALAIATTLSAGDMGVIALFGTDRLSTLPLLIYRLLGGYRLEQAAVVAVCLCALCLALFWSLEQLARLGRDGQLA
jgi:thiamine transport system permease protein